MFRTLSCALTISALFIAAAPAADPKEDGFVSLFNGKTLAGWKYPKTSKDDLGDKTANEDKRFEVDGGSIVCREKNAQGKGGIQDLYTVKEFNTDFVLRMEFRAGPRADSGVYIRGKQLQVRDYPTVGPYKNLKDFKTGDWNHLEIAVKGTTAVCTCNGEVLDAKFAVPEKGAIGVQAEGGKFEFRNIRIKEAK